MDFHNALSEMQAVWTRNRPKNIHLNRPDWMRSADAISAVYHEKSELLRRGTVCYGQIVQANTILFKLFPHVDCPAHIIYSDDPCVAADPQILRQVALLLFRYKDQPLDRVPEQWREIARVITDEYDRSDFRFTIEWQGRPVSFSFLPVMIFRKFLPGRKLSGGLLPVIAAPGCRSVLVLPKRYWTAGFKKLWNQRMI